MTVFQGTDPWIVSGTVTLGGGSVDITDDATRLLGIISGTVDVSDEITRQLGRVVNVTPNNDSVSDETLDALRTLPYPATNNITVTGGANAIATATLPAAGAGLFHYITHLHIRRVATAALAGGALLTVTTTNLGGRTWRTGNQASITVATYDWGLLLDAEYVHPLKSAVANTNTTIVGPAAGAAVSWQIVVDYYIGP